MLMVCPAFCRDFFLFLIYSNVGLPTSCCKKSFIRHGVGHSKVCVSS